MNRRRARETGLIVGQGLPGRWNAISDVAGVVVGHSTIIRGKGKLVPGKGPVRTGVTAVLAHEGNLYEQPVVASVHIINGFGKAVGLAQLLELGRLETPILLTSTLNVGLVQDALTQYVISQNPAVGISQPTPNPVVLECHDGFLNDSQGRHVRQHHVVAAIENADQEVVEGCVGAGTGMIAYGYKSGIGTASRVLPRKFGAYTLGSLVVPNCGRPGDLRLRGVPIGDLLKDRPGGSVTHPQSPSVGGSIIVILATDAPLSARQLGRVARRAVIGIGRTGSVVSHGSGDFVIAFSTAFQESQKTHSRTVRREQVRDSNLTPMFEATIEATEEAILNALCMATAMEGRDHHMAEALPLDVITTRLQHQDKFD